MKLSEELFEHFHRKYQVTREQLDTAIRAVGRVKPKLDAYFLVQAHERKGKS